MGFMRFIFENEIIGITIGTILGFAVTNLMKDIKQELFIPFIKKIHFGNATLISSFIEFMLMFSFVYLLFIVFIQPLFKKELETERKQTVEHKKWRENVLQELQNFTISPNFIKV
jgi:large-conductance mechanosensitive channel